MGSHPCVIACARFNLVRPNRIQCGACAARSAIEDVKQLLEAPQKLTEPPFMEAKTQSEELKASRRIRSTTPTALNRAPGVLNKQGCPLIKSSDS